MTSSRTRVAQRLLGRIVLLDRVGKIIAWVSSSVGGNGLLV